MSEIQLHYTYPDGLGTGGTFTDGDQFSQESIQTIIDDVVRHVRSDERERIIKLLEAKCERPLDPNWEHYYEDGCRCDVIALMKGENK